MQRLYGKEKKGKEHVEPICLPRILFTYRLYHAKFITSNLKPAQCITAFYATVKSNSTKTAASFLYWMWNRGSLVFWRGYTAISVDQYNVLAVIANGWIGYEAGEIFLRREAGNQSAALVNQRLLAGRCEEKNRRPETCKKIREKTLFLAW